MQFRLATGRALAQRRSEHCKQISPLSAGLFFISSGYLQGTKVTLVLAEGS